VSAAVVVSVDVDGPWGLACRPVAGGWGGRLTSRSEAEYGLGRGLDRLLEVLDAHAVRATFFVVGAVAQAAPGRVRELVAAGHEIAHHGYSHRATHTLGAAAQRDEIERGLCALGECSGVAPAGYRSPAWELTPATLAVLVEHGFAYDSSLMGDDRPYALEAGLVEVPVHWTLDDVPYLAFHTEAPARLGGFAVAAELWVAAHDDAVAEGRPVVYTVHPEHTGRAPQHRLLSGLLEHAAGAGTPTCTAAALAETYAARRDPAPARRSTSDPATAIADAPAMPVT
jgi:peptidoglycan/xylan/chitin deacetylase (PgdA/CDA1 family)